MGGSVNVRELALEALLSIAREEAYSHVVVASVLDKYHYMEAREKAFLKRLIEGTVERRIELDYCIDRISNVPTGKMKPLIRELLRMSAYQILFMDGVPDSAVCNEAVKLAQRHSFHTLKGFVNGVLRNMSREKGRIAYPDREKDRVQYLSVRYSMPQWLIRKWDAEQGEDVAEKIMRGLLDERPVTVRVRENLPQEEREALRDELTKQGIQVIESQIVPYAWHLAKAEGMNGIPAFAAGKFTVQDVSSMLAVEAAGIKSGDCVVDVCAAPGGKALFAAEKAGAEGKVLARDVSERKMRQIEQNKNRMHADNMTLQQWDAAEADDAWNGRADAVLADVPCSGLGVIGRKRDIKYRVSAESLESLPPLQRSILKGVWQYVRPGGVLLYSTCTISRAENEDMVTWFLERFPFHADSLGPFLPDCLAQDCGGRGMLQLLPGVHGTDGFFMARLVRDRK